MEDAHILIGSTPLALKGKIITESAASSVYIRRHDVHLLGINGGTLAKASEQEHCLLREALSSTLKAYKIMHAPVFHQHIEVALKTLRLT